MYDVIDSMIFVVGGFNSNSTSCLDDVDCYDTVENKWLTDCRKIPYAAAGIATVVVPENLLGLPVNNTFTR